jgi:HlyD family secretion protein
MKSKLKIVIRVLLLLAVVGGAAWWFFLRPKPDAKLVLSGSIEANTVEVGSLVGGRVQTVHVKEGDTVQAGQPLVTFEPDLRDLEISQQRAVVTQARAELARVKRGPRDEELRQARINYESAEVDRKRFQALWEAGAVAKRDYDAAQVKAANNREILLAAQRGGRPEDVAAANAPVATLLEPDQIWVRVYVPEPQLGKVRIGQAAAVRVDTFPNRAFRGRVVEIRNQAEYTPRNIQTLDQRSDQVFGVKVAIDPVPELKPGMAAIVDLVEPGEAAPAVPAERLGRLR